MQWSSDESFGSGSGEAKVLAATDEGLNKTQWMTYTIEGEHPWKLAVTQVNFTTSG